MKGRDHNPYLRRLHIPLLPADAGAAEGSADTHVAHSVGCAQGTRPGGRRPEWLRVKARTGPNYRGVEALVRGLGLHTVCEEASCPNIYECWEDREATFLILGDRCTRRCGFCDVMTAKPVESGEGEPERVAEAVRAMGLCHVVVTGVARDDLPDGGASVWAACVRAIRAAAPECAVEVLPTDFRARERDVSVVIEAGPDIFAHNLETVRRLHPRIRPAFSYEGSLETLRIAKRLRPDQVTKSNLILGMGETPDEVPEALRDLADAGCEIVTMGQYLRPTTHHLPVDRWVTPSEFAGHKVTGESLGIAHVEAGPLVRSSYHAGRQFRAVRAALV